jgi:hypothetical protein
MPVTLSRTIYTALAVITLTASLAQAALGGGEPKNEWPFTRIVDARTTEGTTPAKASSAIQGEAKNEPPFTRPATIVVASTGGFDWASGGIGAAAGVGAALAGAGALLVARKLPRTA